MSGCYFCQIGDPHEVHQTADEVYSTADALRLDDANHAAGIDPDNDEPQYLRWHVAPDDDDREIW